MYVCGVFTTQALAISYLLAGATEKTPLRVSSADPNTVEEHRDPVWGESDRWAYYGKVWPTELDPDPTNVG
jgi:hypothetical protein